MNDALLERAIADRRAAIERAEHAEAALADLQQAALALFEPMKHGSPGNPYSGHTVEALCTACVRVRAFRTQAIRRALVAQGVMPSVAMRGKTT